MTHIIISNDLVLIFRKNAFLCYRVKRMPSYDNHSVCECDHKIRTYQMKALAYKSSCGGDIITSTYKYNKRINIFSQTHTHTHTHIRCVIRATQFYTNCWQKTYVGMLTGTATFVRKHGCTIVAFRWWKFGKNKVYSKFHLLSKSLSYYLYFVVGLKWLFNDHNLIPVIHN